MLGKLIKHEIRASGKMLFILYPAIIILSIINKALFYFGEQTSSNMIVIPTILSTVLYICLIAAVFVMTLVIMIIRFHKNLLGEEGYLMFALPVKTHDLILSKLIVTVMWFLVAWIVAIGSVLILIPDYSFMKDLPEFIDYISMNFQNNFGISFGAYFALIISIGFVGLIYFILNIYTSISIGHLAYKNRILVSFGAYIGLSIIVQSISMIYLSFTSKDFFSYSFSMYENSPQEIFPVVDSFIFSLIASVILSVIYFFITKFILSKKLNIE